MPTGNLAHTLVIDVDQFGYWGRDNTWRVDAGLIQLGVGLHAGEVAWRDLVVTAPQD